MRDHSTRSGSYMTVAIVYIANQFAEGLREILSVIVSRKCHGLLCFSSRSTFPWMRPPLTDPLLAICVEHRCILGRSCSSSGKLSPGEGSTRGQHRSEDRPASSAAIRWAATLLLCSSPPLILLSPLFQASGGLRGGVASSSYVL